jgi:hypothetical protein
MAKIKLAPVAAVALLRVAIQEALECLEDHQERCRHARGEESKIVTKPISTLRKVLEQTEGVSPTPVLVEKAKEKV